MLKIRQSSDGTKFVEMRIFHHCTREEVVRMVALHYSLGNNDITLKSELFDVLENTLWSLGEYAKDIKDSITDEHMLRAENTVREHMRNF